MNQVTVNSQTYYFSICSATTEKDKAQCPMSYSPNSNTVAQNGQDGASCTATVGSQTSYCNQRTAYTNFCCYCPDGKYAPTGTSMTSASDCFSCPPGSFMGSNLQGIGIGSCIACPTGKYASSSGSTFCTSCPTGKTTFTSNQYSSGTNSFAVGATSADQCVEVPNGLTCSQPPCGFLAKDMSSNSWTGMDYSYPGSYSLSYRYLTACPTFGQLLKATKTADLDPTVGSANVVSDCAACPDSQKYFYAGGESSIQQINNYYNGFSTQLAQYVYGKRTTATFPLPDLPDGGQIDVSYFNEIMTPQCLSECPSDCVVSQSGIGIMYCQKAYPTAVPTVAPTSIPTAAPTSYCTPGTGVMSGLCFCCPAGTYSMGGTESACHPCPSGTYSYAGSSQCLTCRAGKYSDVGQALCVLCPSGTSSQAGSSECRACAAGSFSGPGSSSCESCSSS